MRKRRARRAIPPATSLLLGALAGVAVATGTGVALAERLGTSSVPASLEVTHVPPLLTAEGDRDELRYDVYCVDDRDPEDACAVDGAVYVRPLPGGGFQRVPVRREPGASEGAFVATLPAAGRGPALCQLCFMGRA